MLVTLNPVYLKQWRKKRSPGTKTGAKLLILAI
jgi:hypothetical protein